MGDERNFLNSFLIRFTLAVSGGTFMAFLFNIAAASFVYLFYFSPRLLLLLSGVDSRYYSSRTIGILKKYTDQNLFYTTAQWVGKFYHYHDVFLLLFLGILPRLSDLSRGRRNEGNSFGNTLQDLWNALLSLP